MKTIEEKAKAYDEARERAKQVKLTNTKENVAAAEYIFPDLKESEDERIRKVILKALLTDDAIRVLVDGGVYFEGAEAYLEKQKEQKPNPLCGSTEEYYREAYYADQPKKEQKSHRFCDDTLKAIDKAREFDEQEQKPAEPSGKLSRQDYLYQLLIDQLITYSDYEYLIGQKPAMNTSKAPDKVFMPNELLSEEWQRHIEGEDTEYIRKDALLEWANNWEKIGVSDDFAYAIQTLIKHIESL